MKEHGTQWPLKQVGLLCRLISIEQPYFNGVRFCVNLTTYTKLHMLKKIGIYHKNKRLTLKLNPSKHTGYLLNIGTISWPGEVTPLLRSLY